MPKLTRLNNGKCYCKYMGFSKSSGYNPCEYCKAQDQNKTMPKIKKTKNKNEVIVVGTTQKTLKKTKLLKTVRTPASKENTASYYSCMKNIIRLPENDRVRITELTHKCKCSKEEIQRQKAQVKHKLVHELARDYKNLGENLGRYVQADIVGCAKELSK